jgi:hypothetical protein
MKPKLETKRAEKGLWKSAAPVATVSYLYLED